MDGHERKAEEMALALVRVASGDYETADGSIRVWRVPDVHPPAWNAERVTDGYMLADGARTLADASALAADALADAPLTVGIPGAALDVVLNGSPGDRETAAAQAARRVRRGRGHTAFITAPRDVLEEIGLYLESVAGVVGDMSASERDGGNEHVAAAVGARRIAEALTDAANADAPETTYYVEVLSGGQWRKVRGAEGGPWRARDRAERIAEARERATPVGLSSTEGKPHRVTERREGRVSE